MFIGKELFNLKFCVACESVEHTIMQTKRSSDRSWVSCLMGHGLQNDPLSALHRVANETSLNQMADSVDDEQYATL